MQNKPPYAIDAVDNALRLLLALRRDGVVRVSDAAADLGVARSTAHRLLRMLVHHGFAVQRDDRSYALAPSGPDHDTLRTTLRPVLERVRRETDETVHLMVRDGVEMVFLDSIEGGRALRVGSRAGTRLPAETVSGGRAVLAQLPVDTVRALYAGRPNPDRLTRLLARTRRQGYGINVEETERGVAAVGVAVPDPDGVPVAAVGISMPTLRFRRAAAPDLALLLQRALSDRSPR